MGFLIGMVLAWLLFLFVGYQCTKYQDRWIKVCHLVGESSSSAKPEEVFERLSALVEIEESYRKWIKGEDE